MKILTACICETATVDPSTMTLSIAGGWPEWLSVPALPARRPFTLAVVAQIDRVEMGINLHIDVQIQREADGALLAQSDISFQRPPVHNYDPSAPLTVPFVLPLEVEFGSAGGHRVRLQHRNDPATSVPFGVRIG